MNIPLVVIIMQLVAHFSPKPPPPKQPEQEIIYKALDIPDNEIIERN